MKKQAVAAALGLGLILAVPGCSTEPATRVIVSPSEEGTKTITPLERGTIRREALEDIRTGVDAWVANDIGGVTAHFEQPARGMLLDKWARLAKDGKRVVHVHRDAKLTMIDLKKDGSQALVNYDFIDESYVVGKSGARTEKGSGKATEIQLTIEMRGETWVVIRMIGGSDAIR